MRISVLALLATLTSLLLFACGSGSGQPAAGTPDAQRAAPAAREVLLAGRWRVRAFVRPRRIGPVRFEARNLRRFEPRPPGGPWIEHDLVLRNTGDRPVTFADTRGSRYIGPRGRKRLLVADEGCGVARNRPGAPWVAGACHTYLDRIALEPRSSARRSITLTRGIPGMDPLRPGTYVYPRPVRFRVEGKHRRKASARTGVIRIVYKVTPTRR